MISFKAFLNEIFADIGDFIRYWGSTSIFEILYDFLIVDGFLIPWLDAGEHFDNKAANPPNIGFLKVLME